MTGLVGSVAGVAAALAFVLLWALRPFLLRYALARPDARSSHRVPTPQGGGLAVVAAALVAGAAGLRIAGLDDARMAWLVVVVTILAATGLADDLRPLSAGVRLAVQAVCAALLVTFVLPPAALAEGLPSGVVATVLVLGIVWWTNLTNFMDGLDWMSVAEFVPVSLGLVVIGLAGHAGPEVAVAAAALLGALLGFAPWNRPVARLFLGDVGSLPIGIATGWMLLDLAGRGGVAAAILLPLYYVADATITLGRRALAREPVWKAHRSHYYQRARDNGLGVLAIDGRVAALNLSLLGLAGATLHWPALPVQLGCLAAGAGLVGMTLRRFATRLG